MKFEINRIEISFNDSLEKNFVKDLSSKLFEWTGDRWIITFSQLKGELSINEKKKIIREKLIYDAKSTEIYQRVVKNFPDAELIDVNLIKNNEETNND